MRRGLILGGGGANGEWQAEVIRLLEGYGYDRWDYIAGVSTGALQASGYRKGGTAMLDRVWREVTEDKVFTRRSKIALAWHLVNGGLGIHDHAPLRKLLEKELGKLTVLGADVGYVRLDTGEYKPVAATVGSVLASCTIPGVFDAVDRNLVDGGVIDVCPLGQAVDHQLDEIIVIVCNPLDSFPFAQRPKNIVELLKRTWEIVYHEHQRNDLDGFLRINRILRQLPPGVTVYKDNGQPYVAGNVTIIQPDPPGLPDSLDFSPVAKAARRKMANTVVPRMFNQEVAA